MYLAVANSSPWSNRPQGCSIGVAELDQEERGADMLAAAEHALAEAKRAGQGCIRFEASMIA